MVSAFRVPYMKLDLGVESPLDTCGFVYAPVELLDANQWLQDLGHAVPVQAMLPRKRKEIRMTGSGRSVKERLSCRKRRRSDRGDSLAVRRRYTRGTNRERER